jgi:hypothetical protein
VADILNDFITLFRGRADCYGSWEGGCIKEPLTERVFRQHLTTGPHIGVYPAFNIKGIAHCVWGCTDIDYDDFDEARRLQSTFDAVGVRAWTEKTRKGWHIWVFAENLVPAENMRNMFLAAHQVANSTPKEVNPKQTVLHGNAIGNYVRLPYPTGDGANVRYIVDGGERLDLETFTHRALETITSAEKIADLATYYIPPVIPTREVLAPSHDMTEAARRLTPLGKVVFRDGPIEGRDRSTALACLAHQCHEAGLPAGDALSLMEDADLRWGKFLMRGETGRIELIKLVERAYGVTLST